MDYESYYMTEKEFYVLLAGKNISQFYGLSSESNWGQQSDITTEDLYRILGSLYQKGYVSWHGNLVKLEGFAAELISFLKSADCCIELTMPEQEAENTIFYLSGGNVVMMEPGHTQEKVFRITMLPLDELSVLLTDLEIFPEEDILFDEEEEQEKLNSDSINSLKVASLQLIHPLEGRQLGRIDVLSEGIDTFMKIYRNLSHKKVHYTPSNFFSELEVLRKEEF